MPYQNSLWGVQIREIGKNLGPVSHTHDPETSHAAERSITASGKRKSNNQRVAWLVCRHPGMTASELTHIAWHMNPPIFSPMSEDKMLIEIRRRLSDMNNKHVKQGDARLGLLRKQEVTWYPK